MASLILSTNNSKSSIDRGSAADAVGYSDEDRGGRGEGAGLPAQPRRQCHLPRPQGVQRASRLGASSLLISLNDSLLCVCIRPNTYL